MKNENSFGSDEENKVEIKTLKLGEMASKTINSGLKSYFTDPFANTNYDKK